MVTVLKKCSDIPWSDSKGLNVTKDMEDVFNAYVKVCLVIPSLHAWTNHPSVKPQSASIQKLRISSL